MSILFKHATLIRIIDGSYSVETDVYLGIRDELIDYIGSDMPEDSYILELDYKNKLIMPSFVNSHSHTPMTLLRGLGSGLPLHRWLNEAIWPVEEKLTHDLVGIGSRLAIAEMIAGGVTSFSDMYFLSNATADEVIQSGIKANLSWAVIGFDQHQDLIHNEDFKAFKSLYETYHNAADGKLKIDFALHAEYTITERLAKQYGDHLNDVGGNLHVHLSETDKEVRDCLDRHGKTPTEFFLDCGLLEQTVQAAHCVSLTDNDLDILAAKDVTIIHNPSSNMLLGSGFAPIGKMLTRHIPVSLGTDGSASNNNLNMAEEMHLSYLIHKGYHKDPTLLTPTNLLDMATINGSRMQGRFNTGLIEVGMKADLMGIDMDRLHLKPALDIMTLLVTSLQASDVCLTVCNGKVLYENGEYTTIDMEKLDYEVKKAVKSLY